MAEEKNISNAEQTAPEPETTEEAVTGIAAEEVAVEEVVAEEVVAEEVAVEEVAVEEAVAEEIVAEEGGIFDKLKEAAGNIQKASADARTRRSEQEKTNKTAEAEAQERIEEIEKKHQEDERLAQIVAEQKLAALDYAQNYRKKLMKDRQKAVSAAKLREKQEKEAEAARVREEKAKEIAEQLEKERDEAHERGEKATALLNRVTKCAIVDENGNLRMVDRMDIKKGTLDANGDPIEKKEAEIAEEKEAEKTPVAVEEKPAPEVKKVATPTTVYEYSEPVNEFEAARREVEDFLVGEMLNTSDDKFVLNIEDDRMVVELTSLDDPLIAPDNYNPTADQYAREIDIAKAQHEYILSAIRESTEIAKSEMMRIISEEQERFDYEIKALNAHRVELADSFARRRQAVIDEINSIVSTPVALPETGCNVTRETAEAYESIAADSNTDEAAIVECSEETVAAPIGDDEKNDAKVSSLEPVVSSDPVVAELREMGEAVTTKKQLKKYLKKSKKAIKRFNKQKAKYDETVSEMGDMSATYVTIIKSLMICGRVLEIKCDNVSAAARIVNSRLLKKCMNSLYAEIEEYNRKAGDFAAITGEELTRVSAFLPERLAAGTGKAVIPALAFRERYEQLQKEEEAPTSYTFTFPSLASLVNGTAANGYPTVTAHEAESKKNNITLSRTVISPLTEQTLVGEVSVKSKRQYKKLLKLAKKADKKLNKEASRLGNTEGNRDKTVMLLSIERERTLVVARVFIASLSLGITKFIMKAKCELIDAFARYNGFVRKCEEACNTSITAIHSATAEKIAEAKLMPDMPVMVHLTELYETVGEMTRVVGEPEAKSKALDACCTFIFGGAAPLAATSDIAVGGIVAGGMLSPSSTSETAPVSRIATETAVMAATEAAPVSRIAAETTAMAAPEAAENGTGAAVSVVEDNNQEEKVDVPSDKLDSKAFAKYKKASEKNYKATKSEIEKLDALRKTSEGEELVDVDVKRLAIVRNLIDSLADNVAVSAVSGQKSYLKQSKKRLESEITLHNSIVADLRVNGNIILSEVSEDLYNAIIAGNGYYKTPKFEYQIIERAPTQNVRVVETEQKESTPRAEYNTRANRVMKVMNKKELSKLLKASKKENNAIKEEFSNIEKQKAVSVGRERVMLVVNALTTQKKAVSIAADNLLAAAQVSTSKKQIDKLRKSLDAEINLYNKVVDEYEEVTGDSITKADVAMAEKIVTGRPYSEIPDITYAVNTSVYEYDFADFTAYEVKNENDKKLAAAQAHNRVERSNAVTYEIAQLSSRIAKQQNKDLELIAARFMFEKGLLQSKNDMLAYRYTVSQKSNITSEKEIERRCKELDDKGKKALVAEEADNRRYYEIISTNPEAAKLAKRKGLFRKTYTKDDVADIRDKVMQLLNERDHINSKLLSIYTGAEVDLDGHAITLEMRKIKTAAAAKEYKKLAGKAKKAGKLRAERRDKQKLYDLLNTQIDAKSTVALAKYRLKHETLPAYEKKQLKNDIKINKKAAKKAAKRFDWLFKRLKNLGTDMGGSWMMGIGLLLVVIIGAIAAFLYFFGADFFGAIGSMAGF